MANYKLTKLKGREVIDSRGNPTLEVEAYCGRISASAIVPSGASTGIYEALELRDKDHRFNGKGVQEAVKKVHFLSKKLKGVDVTKQKQVDTLMIGLDGTAKKTRFGANTILGISMACCRLAAKCKNQELYKHLAMLYGNKKVSVPVPFCNIINGGEHAGNDLPMQEFMIVPKKAKTFAEALRMVSETYQILKNLIEKKYGKTATGVGDEGGFAPPISKAEDALNLITKAIDDAGYNKKISIAMDPAASEFYMNNVYKYKLHKNYSPKQLKNYYLRLAQKYDIISIEDPFDQDDFDSYQLLMDDANFQVVGDDLLVTSVDRINIASEKNLCNALLLKVNQIGSVSEAMAASHVAMQNKWNVMVSHRSGETEDTFIADLAVALGCNEIKIGAPCRGERTAKFNRLLRIEEILGPTFYNRKI
ncbi:MAG: phosphopyruvate hydratase [Nanoarchaeota archaeon]